MRAALIGCGAIAEYHAPALKAAGFTITAVASRPGSRTVAAFSLRHGIPNVFPSPQELLAARGLWDALLIAVPPQATLPILKEAVALGVPTLVEKPAACTAAELKPLLKREAPVIVGYNRRFYASVQALQSLVNERSGPFIGQLVISEPALQGAGDDPARAFAERLVFNSVHALDLLRFLLGELRIESARAVAREGSFGVVAILRAEDSGSLVNLTAVAGAPVNVSLNLFQPDLALHLQPFETLRVYRSMQRIEPDEKTPWRRYVPELAGQVELDPPDAAYKPGFYRQALAFKRLVCGEKPQGAATLTDAYRALRLAEGLIAALEGATLNRSGETQ